MLDQPVLMLIKRECSVNTSVFDFVSVRKKAYVPREEKMNLLTMSTMALVLGFTFGKSVFVFVRGWLFTLKRNIIPQVRALLT